MNTLSMMGAKAAVLLMGWLIALLPPLSAILLWRSYGGSAYAPELTTLIAGHVLNAGLTIGLAAAMASLAEHHSTAAILTLSVTVGTWIVSILGWPDYTPAAMVAEFQHGLIRLDVVFVALVLTFLGLAVAAIWMRLGIHVRRRVYGEIGRRSGGPLRRSHDVCGKLSPRELGSVRRSRHAIRFPKRMNGLSSRFTG